MTILKNIKLDALILLIILTYTHEQPNIKPRDENDFGPPSDRRDDNRNMNINNINKLNKINDLKKKKEDIIKENINSKAKLKKYIRLYYIIEIINIFFALFIVLYLIIKIFNYYKSRQTGIEANPNNIISYVEVFPNDNNIYKSRMDERTIYKQSFEIKSENNVEDNKEAPPIFQV